MATALAHDVRWYDGQYHGVRMTADEFFDLPDDGYKYELVQGVVVMSPSPKPRHQAVAVEIITNWRFTFGAWVGQVVAKPIAARARYAGNDFVYRRIHFIQAER